MTPPPQWTWAQCVRRDGSASTGPRNAVLPRGPLAAFVSVQQFRHVRKSASVMRRPSVGSKVVFRRFIGAVIAVLTAPVHGEIREAMHFLRGPAGVCR